MEDHIIDPSWVERVGDLLNCVDCIGKGNEPLCNSLPDDCGELGGVYKWKPYIDPCPLERNGRSRVVMQFRGTWYERIPSKDSTCNRCDNCDLQLFIDDPGYLSTYGCLDMIDGQEVLYYWKAI